MNEPADAPPEQNAFEAGRFEIKTAIEKRLYQLREQNQEKSQDYISGWLDATAAILLELDSL